MIYLAVLFLVTYMVNKNWQWQYVSVSDKSEVNATQAAHVPLTLNQAYQLPQTGRTDEHCTLQWLVVRACFEPLSLSFSLHNLLHSKEVHSNHDRDSVFVWDQTKRNICLPCWIFSLLHLLKYSVKIKITNVVHTLIRRHFVYNRASKL